MSLLTRLTVPLDGEEKIPSHQFMAALAELQRGAPGVTQAAIAVAFGLSTQEQAQLATFITNLVTSGSINRELIHDVLLLGEGQQYSLSQVMNRLGIG